jgi:hypothetical protein
MSQLLEAFVLDNASIVTNLSMPIAAPGPPRGATIVVRQAREER